MSIDRAQVRHLAALARIGIADAEIDVCARQLSGIIDQFQILNELDTDGVEPAAHAGEIRAVMRPDTPAESLPPAEALRNAPNQQGDYFRVKAVLDE